MVSMVLTFSQVVIVACPRAQHHIFQVQSASVNQGDGTGSSGADATVNDIPGREAYARSVTTTVGLHKLKVSHAQLLK